MPYLFLAILIVLLVIDWRQTLVIARNPGRWTERNPLLGKHPSERRVHVYFALVVTVVLVTAYMLRNDPSIMGWLALAAAIAEAVPVISNYIKKIRPNWRIG
jgi:hypothetical protein